MKRKSLTLLVCLLACLALGSVGFAAWVITSNDSATQNGTIRVDVVKDARLDITAEIADDDKTIIFGAKAKDPSVTGKWMKYEESNVGGTLLNEDLKATIKITISNFEYVDTLTITLTEDTSSFYAQAKALGYVGELPVITKTYKQLKDLANEKSDDKNEIDSDGKLTVYLDIEFAWGDTFGGKNPIDYYNAQEYSKALGDDSIAKLDELREILEGTEGLEHTVTYVATVAVTTK